MEENHQRGYCVGCPAGSRRTAPDSGLWWLGEPGRRQIQHLLLGWMGPSCGQRPPPLGRRRPRLGGQAPPEFSSCQWFLTWTENHFRWNPGAGWHCLRRAEPLNWRGLWPESAAPALLQLFLHNACEGLVAKGQDLRWQGELACLPGALWPGAAVPGYLKASSFSGEGEAESGGAGLLALAFRPEPAPATAPGQLGRPDLAHGELGNLLPGLLQELGPGRPSLQLGPAKCSAVQPSRRGLASLLARHHVFACLPTSHNLLRLGSPVGLGAKPGQQQPLRLPVGKA